jgi:hypothetical protein
MVGSGVELVQCSRWRGALGAPCASSEIEHVAVDLSTVDLRIVPLYTVTGFFGSTLIEQIQEFLIAANVILLNVVLNALIVLNPENNIPGLVISPTVVGNVQQVGLVGAGCGCHGVQVV